MGNRRVWKAIALAGSFGCTAALLTLGGVLGGRWIDAEMHTTPIFTICGLCVGLGAGVMVFGHEVKRILGDSQDP